MTNNSAAAKNEGLLKEMSVIPFNTRINEWLEKAEAQLHKPPLYSPSIGPADTTNGNTAPFINTTLLAPPSVCTSFNVSKGTRLVSFIVLLNRLAQLRVD